MREANRKTKSKIFLKFIIGVGLSLVIFFIFVIFKSNYFKIKIINIKADNVSCVDENNLTERSTLLGNNFFFIDEQKIEDKLKKDFICIKNINFSKRLPSKIIIDIEGRKGVAVLATVKYSEASISSIIENIATPPRILPKDSFLVDDSGVVFVNNDGLTKLPRIDVVGLDIAVGFKFENDYLKKTLKIMNELEHLVIDNPSVLILNKFLISQSKPKIVFNLDENIDIQIASLQLILQKAKMDSEEFEFIDLRFDKPLVRIAPKKK